MKSDKPSQYFEGTLQLRNPTQEIIDFVADEVERAEGVWIAKTQKQKRGIDLYLSSNAFLKKIGRKLQARFTGEVIESNSLFTRSHQTSKEVYRGCVLFRYINIKKGDVITVRGEEYEVVQISAKVLTKNVQTQKKRMFRFSDLSAAGIS